MFKPLNVELYIRITQVFKEVQVVKKSIASGVRAKKNIFYTSGGPKTKFSPQNPYELVYGDWGETYSVCCPKCGDSRFRLHISHMWNVELQPGLVTRNLVKCFNEDCTWKDLDIHLSLGKLTGGLKPVSSSSINKSISRPARVMKLPSRPENIHFLSELDDNHPAVIYAKSRGLDPELVSKAYGVSFCSKSNWKTPIKDSSGKVWYVSPEDRLILPNLDADGSWNGWQARWIGGFRYSDDVSTWDKVPRDPSKGNEILPKYLTAPGMMAKATVFNVGRAAGLTGGKLCFVSEGPVSAIASGPCGVCTFGMRMSQVQIDTLAKHFKYGRIIILKESEDDPTQSCLALDKLVSGGCHIVTLPPKTDAADLGFEKTLELIHKTIGHAL
jgi:hypothetical protein